MRKNTLSRKTLLLSFILFVSLGIAAQPVCQIQHFSAYNGLAQKTVTNIIQDSKGFIWFSTWNGLNKFDGYTFRNYKAFPGDGSTLTSNRLSSITQTQTCDIWCHTYDYRVYLFDSRDEKFIDILRPYENRNQRTYAVRTVHALPKGISWILCEQEAFRVDEKECKAGEGINLYSPEQGNLKGSYIINVYQDSEGDEWILTNKGISIIGRKKIESDIPFKSIMENNGNIYLVSQDNRMVVYNPKTQQLRFNEMPFPTSDAIYSLQDLGSDSIGLCTDAGLYVYYRSEEL